MCALAYHRFEPARCAMAGPGPPSITSAGCDAASSAKKNSGPLDMLAVPSFSALASKLAVIASCSPGWSDLAISISCSAVDLSAANATGLSESKTSASNHAQPQKPFRPRRVVSNAVASIVAPEIPSLISPHIESLLMNTLARSHNSLCTLPRCGGGGQQAVTTNAELSR